MSLGFVSKQPNDDSSLREELVRAMKKIGNRLVTILGMFVFFISLSYAQMHVGNIVGTITDPTGAVVPSAKLALVNQATQVTQEAQTNASGFYTFKALPVGRYKLSVTLSGFQTYERPDIQIVSGETVTLTSSWLWDRRLKRLR